MRAHRDMIVTPKILPGGSAKLRWAGRGTGDLLFHSLCGPVERKNPWRGLPKFDIFYIYIFGGRIRNSEAATSGGGGAQRPVWRVNEPEKTGARSARARTRGQNPLVWKDLSWTAESYRLLKYWGRYTIALFQISLWCDNGVAARLYAVICKQLLISNDRNMVHWVVLGLPQAGACTDLFENLSEISLKGELSNATTFNPPLFSSVNTFK